MVKRKFAYKKRSVDKLKKRGEGAQSFGDGYIKDGFKFFTPKEGDNFIRILPPTWEDAEHYGMDIYVHYGIGGNNSSYLCNTKMGKGNCPICNEKDILKAEGKEEDAKKLNPTRRVLVWVINRDAEEEGIKVWPMPWTLDRDICLGQVDKRTGEALYIDDPDEGYDIEFTRKGKGRNTEYLGISIARRPTPLGNKEWLEQVINTPVTDCLMFFPDEHIDNVFNGRATKERVDAVVEEKVEPVVEVKKETKEVRDEVNEGVESEITYNDLKLMSKDELVDIAIEDYNISKDEVDDIDTTKSFVLNLICKEAGIEVPQEVKVEAVTKIEKVRDRLKRLKQSHV